MQGRLFEVPEPVPEPVEKLSADRRRTQLQAARIARGLHPLGGSLGYPLPLHRDAEKSRTAGGPRCGSCRYRAVIPWHSRSYPKCLFGYQSLDAGGNENPPRATHGAGSDVRAWWPACPDWEPGDRGLSDDAARWIGRPLD